MAESYEELSKEITKLPAGCIVKKTINGKIYLYHQWKEAGKTKNRCISQEEADELRLLIEKRKLLSKKLSAMKPMKTVVSKITSEKESIPTFKMNVILGSSLLATAETARQFDKRDCFSKIQNFIHTPAMDKVCLVFGLRRTGKTTLLKQLILEMTEEERAKTIYIKATSEDTIENLNEDMKTANKAGYKFILIDEITLIDKFIDNAALLSDVYAVQGMKIVLSGTDSLGFWFAQNEELYDRAITVHTTFVPFREHSRLLGINDIDEYIRYGGTLKAGETAFEDSDANKYDASFRDDESTRRYIDTAIAKNIQHSLKCYDRGNHFRNLIQLYKKNELTNAINRIIEDMNKSFTVDVIQRDFKSNDLGSAKDLLRRERDSAKRTDVLDHIDTTDIVNKLMSILEIRNSENQTVNIEEIHIQEIKEYLKALDLIETVQTENLPISNNRENRIIFTQPGMRFCQAQVLVYSLMQDEVFGSLDGDTRDIITDKILEDVRGRMLEDIVFLETKRFYGRTRNVFKLKFAVGEFDMVIQDKSKKQCEIFEIKHSKNIVPRQYRFISDEEKIEQTERQFGKVVRKCVLYRGKSQLLENGIEYKNVEEFLKQE